jgi:DNA primase
MTSRFGSTIFSTPKSTGSSSLFSGYGTALGLLRGDLMPGINFATVRAQVSISQVLELLNFSPLSCREDQLRGPCPIHDSDLHDRSFSVNLSKNTYRCFRCGSAGNQLDLWAAATRANLHAAAVNLCQRLNLETPWMAH